MKVQIQIELDLGGDTRTMSNVVAAVEDATAAAVERLGFGLQNEEHSLSARVRTEVRSFDETITVSKDVYTA